MNCTVNWLMKTSASHSPAVWILFEFVSDKTAHWCNTACYSRALDRGRFWTLDEARQHYSSDLKWYWKEFQSASSYSYGCVIWHYGASGSVFLLSPGVSDVMMLHGSTLSLTSAFLAFFLFSISLFCQVSSLSQPQPQFKSRLLNIDGINIL